MSALPEITDDVVAFAAKVARSAFSKRGNHSEIHLQESELATLIAAAILLSTEDPKEPK